MVPHAPGHSSNGTRYLFYLHGRIVEDRGPTAVSPDFGPYQYLAIVDAFADSGFAVVSEARAPDTDVQAYADSVIRQVRRLVATGALPSDITVVGASKGAVIAMLVATKLPVAGLRFVLLGNCNDAVQRRFPLHLHGDVLSIYEASDSIGHSCVPIFEQSPALGRRQELRLESGLSHGFLFRPLGAWVGPTVAWARRGGA